jgi:hypothetical protein
MNCWFVPSGIEGIAGVIAIETSCAGEIVSEVDPVTEPEVAEIVVVPTATLVARPVAEIVTAPVLEELQVADEVRFCVLPSLNVPVAVNGWVVPSAIVEFAGATAIDCKAAGSTVSDDVFEAIDPDDAVTFVVPVATVEASPVVLIVATEGFDKVQITDPDRSCVLPSVKMPVAANCWVVPSGIEATVGVNEIETRAAVFTVRVACPEIEPEDAVMVVVPRLWELARPANTVATPGAEELQAAVAVRTLVLPSEYVPVAANCSVVPSGIEVLDGATAIDTKTRGVTVRVVFPVTLGAIAAMVVVPAPMEVARPVELIVATEVLLERQVTSFVRFLVVPFEYVPVAVNCTVWPCDTERFAGVTVILTRTTLVNAVSAL